MFLFPCINLSNSRKLIDIFVLMTLWLDKTWVINIIRAISNSFVVTIISLAQYCLTTHLDSELAWKWELRQDKLPLDILCNIVGKTLIHAVKSSLHFNHWEQLLNSEEFLVLGNPDLELKFFQGKYLIKAWTDMVGVCIVLTRQLNYFISLSISYISLQIRGKLYQTFHSQTKSCGLISQIN